MARTASARRIAARERVTQTKAAQLERINQLSKLAVEFGVHQSTAADVDDDAREKTKEIDTKAAKEKQEVLEQAENDKRDAWAAAASTVADMVQLARNTAEVAEWLGLSPAEVRKLHAQHDDAPGQRPRRERKTNEEKQPQPDGAAPSVPTAPPAQVPTAGRVMSPEAEPNATPGVVVNGQPDSLAPGDLSHRTAM